MNAYGYGWQKLYGAIHSLAGENSQKERLVNAIAYNLIHITPEKDLPSELRDEFRQFMKKMTSVTAKSNEGTIQATITQLDEIETHRAIEKIISFHDTICRHMKPF